MGEVLYERYKTRENASVFGAFPAPRLPHFSLLTPQNRQLQGYTVYATDCMLRVKPCGDLDIHLSGSLLRRGFFKGLIWETRFEISLQGKN